MAGTILAPLVKQSNSAARCTFISGAYDLKMSTSKKVKIEPVHVEEAARLKALFKSHTDLSQEAFGATFEIGSQGMVWQYLNARSPLNTDAALKFARGLGCQVTDFSPRLAEALRPTPPGVPMRRGVEVPIVGTTQGGPPDRIWEEIGYPTGHGGLYVDVATGDANAYGLRVVGDSMAPRIMEGEWIVVEPNTVPQPGDDVVVKTVDGEVMVKQLVAEHGDTVILASINEAFKRITRPLSDIVFIHYVGPRLPARAIKRRIETESYCGEDRRHGAKPVRPNRRKE